VPNSGGRTLVDVNSAEELKKLLLTTGRTRKWLAERTGYTEVTVKQYLNGSKESGPFFKKVRKVLLAELALISPEAKPPLQWDLLFETEEQFRRVDRASRRVNAEGIIEFCRDTLLNRANELLESEELGRYPAGKVRSLKVGETPPGEDPE
jgi:hypothetical protein